ncbi:hypothetical protein BpHYR1_031967 [Brachionus plicatilis]|uniref:Uncharacterized protein n=1 Tax=Brachionus plicatilis TaxID=10195 RepID=A0A3M7SNM8_BRAPC|nr:hypothetical protein BpHYR1_031967 [Brachionus plicatilis]
MPALSDEFQVDQSVHEKAKLQDTVAKRRMKVYNDNKLRACPNNFKVGEMVLLKCEFGSVLKSQIPYLIQIRLVLSRNASLIRRYILIVLNDLSSEDFVFGKATNKNSVLDETLGDVLKDEGKLDSDGFQISEEGEELEVDGQGREDLEEEQT